MMKKIFIFLLISLCLWANEQSKFIRDKNIVYDKELKLYWQDDKSVETNKYTLENSIKYCKDLNLNSYTNWRLPTYKELLSIGDYEVYKPTLNETFKHSASGHFWSIIYKRVAFGKEWKPIKDFYVKRIYFSDGYSYDNDRTGKAYVRCVREKKNSK
tara:strand:- start:51 stop:521 length:471 start_codon:yes stop_codon:yes gene_type:complete